MNVMSKNVSCLYLTKMDRLDHLLVKKEHLEMCDESAHIDVKIKLMLQIEELLVEMRLMELQLMK